MATKYVKLTHVYFSPLRHNTNIWHEGRIQFACLQPAPVDAFEQRMSLYVTYALSTATQAHSGILVQQLYNTSSTYSIDTLHSARTKTSNLYNDIAAPSSSHLFTARLGVVSKLARVNFIVFTNPPVNFVAFDLFFSSAKRRLHTEHPSVSTVQILLSTILNSVQFNWFIDNIYIKRTPESMHA